MTTTTIAIAAAIAIGLSTIAPAIAQGLAASKALEGMALSLIHILRQDDYKCRYQKNCC